jgi:hypothetical protein
MLLQLATAAGFFQFGVSLLHYLSFLLWGMVMSELVWIGEWTRKDVLLSTYIPNAILVVRDHFGKICFCQKMNMEGVLGAFSETLMLF